MLPLLLALSVAEARDWKVAAMPIAAYSSDTKLGGGFYALLVFKDPENPDGLWRARFSTQIYATTGGYRDHWLKLDLPNTFGSKFRWDLMTGWESWAYAPYYGYGNNTPRTLPEELPADEDPNDNLNTFYKYDLRGFKLQSNLRRPIGGDFDFFANFYMRFADVYAYQGSLLAEETPWGYDGGRYSRVGAGIMWDTRDTEPTPTKGMFSELSVRTSGPWTGSQFTSFGVNITDRRYITIIPERIIFSNRVIADARWGDDPFFMQDMLGGSQSVSTGGNLAWRGYPWGRFRGDVALIVSPELRTRVFKLTVAKTHSFELMAVPFTDIGRVWLWEGEEDDSLAHLHIGGGLGTRWIWDKDMVVRGDVGWAREEFKDGSTAAQMGIYLTFDHPF